MSVDNPLLELHRRLAAPDTLLLFAHILHQHERMLAALQHLKSFSGRGKPGGRKSPYATGAVRQSSIMV